MPGKSRVGQAHGVSHVLAKLCGLVTYPYSKPMSQAPCAFCTLPDSRIVARNEHALVIRDGFPISPGHTLIIPTRHIGSFFDLEPAEQASVLELLDAAKRQLDVEYKPQGYNIGINDGPAAGQTVTSKHTISSE